MGALAFVVCTTHLLFTYILILNLGISYYLLYLQVNEPYAFISSTLTFWAPVIVMLFMYRRIYKEAVRQKEAIRRSSVPSQQHLIVDSDSVCSKQTCTAQPSRMSHFGELSDVVGGYLTKHFAKMPKITIS